MRTFIVDSFTDIAFRGNPAGVCWSESGWSDAWMLQIAQELNLSETAFIRPLESEDSYAIRFFSPKMEIPLCGHATLAAAKVVFHEKPGDQVTFINHQGIALLTQNVSPAIHMEFPLYQTRPASAPQPLLSALGLHSIQNSVYNQETRILLLEIDSPSVLRQLKPDFKALQESHQELNGVLVTSPSDSTEFDFYSRYFWPWSGTDEDPVTGGTHTFLAPYWCAKLGKEQLRSFQASPRTGFMTVNVGVNSVIIEGQAVIVFQGVLTVSEGTVS